MSLLIKGINVSNHIICITVFPEGFAIVEEYEMLLPIKAMKCEVASVPTPHGRLIDADAMVGDDNEAYKTAQLALMGAGSGADAMRMVYEVAHKNLQMLIADAPTVIEAEEYKNGDS